MNNDFKAALFDLDGVIVDTAKYHFLAWKVLADRENIYFDEEINERLKGVSRMDSLDIILEKRHRDYMDAEKEAMAAEKNGIYVEMINKLTPDDILEGVVLFLKSLRENNIKTSVCSVSKSANLIIEKLKLTEYFDTIVGGNDIKKSKPDPEVFLTGAKRLSVDAADCVVFEDAYAGIEGAIAAKMKSVGLGKPEILTNADVVYTKMSLFGIDDVKKLFSNDIISRNHYNKCDLNKNETIFTLSNTYMGVRGIEEEKPEGSKPGLYIAGLFDKSECLIPEIVNFMDFQSFYIKLDGKKISADTCEIKAYKRELDMKNGTLNREITFAIDEKRQITIESERFLSFYDVNCGASFYKITADFDAEISVFTEYDSSQLSREGSYLYDEGVKHYHVIKTNDQYEDNFYSRLKLRDKGILVDIAACTMSEGKKSRKIFGDMVLEEIKLNLNKNKQSVLYKYFVVTDSRDIKENVLESISITKLERLKNNGFKNELSKSVSVLAEKWKNSDVIISGDKESDLSLRFNIYNLIGLGSETSTEFSIGAKGLSTERYGGHYFWDTEIYLMPFYINTAPIVARNLLMFRYNTLEKAKKRAKEQGYSGCLWAWQSDADGDEGIRQTVYDDGFVERRHILDQYHIVSDVAFSCLKYLEKTDDEHFFRQYLSQLVVEAMRFWKSYILKSNNPDALEYEIKNVMGPDEYHITVDNNYYTNYLTKYVFKTFFDYLDNSSRKQKYDIYNINCLADDELTELKKIGEKIRLPELKNNVMEQFDGYFKLKDLVIDKFNEKGLPLYPDQTVGAGLPDTERQDAFQADATNTQLIKQGDSVLTICVNPEDFSDKIIAANYKYYTDRTLHYSSLSPGVYSLLGAIAKKPDEAYKLYKLGANMDLEDVKEETEYGLHTACHAGAYQSVVEGFAGVRPTGKYLKIDPSLPKNWDRVEFSMSYKGHKLKISVEQDSVRLKSEENASFNIWYNGKIIEFSNALDLRK